MLDIRFIRENADKVAEKAKQKGYEVDIQQLLGFDDKKREMLQKVEALRHQRNELTESAKGQKPSDEQLEKGRNLKDELTDLEHQLTSVEKEFSDLLRQVPNIPTDDVPVGASEADNQITKEWGDKPNFDFQPKTHWEIAESRGLIDKKRAAKVSGSRFAYIKGDLVKLQLAIIQFVIDNLTSEETLKNIIQENGLQNISSRPFTPVLPPLMLRTEVYESMDRLEPREERYKVGNDEDDLWLQGSAEHTLGPMYMNEVIDLSELPVRLLGYATSFRREAGSYGKDIEGIIRMHQFDKLEMESFVNAEGGIGEHLFFVAIQEYLMQQLKIPYRILLKCTADIGKPNARGVDLEAWLPGAGKYMETHTADFMSDYQSRRLNIRNKVLDSGGMHDTKAFPMNFVHTNDATAFALGRTMVAIIENYQDKDGNVGVPPVLQKYMNGKTVL